MKKIKTFILGILGVSSISCNSQMNQENNTILTNIIENKNFERYLFVKGENLINIEPIIQEWAEIFSEDEPVSLNLSYAKTEDWIVIKINGESNLSPYNFHNLVYWFLGNPPEDNNYADYSIGISQNKNETYILFNDYYLRENIATVDDLFGITKDNIKFTLSVPFGEIKRIESYDIPNFQSFLSTNNINLRVFEDEKLNWKTYNINLE